MGPPKKMSRRWVCGLYFSTFLLEMIRKIRWSLTFLPPVPSPYILSPPETDNQESKNNKIIFYHEPGIQKK